MSRSQKIERLLFCQLATALIPFNDCSNCPRISVLRIPAAESLDQEAIGLHTLNTEHEYSFCTHILNGETAVNSRVLAQTAGGVWIIDRAERDDDIFRLSKFLQRNRAPSGVPRRKGTLFSSAMGEGRQQFVMRN
jgi:hypothetical protein